MSYPILDTFTGFEGVLFGSVEPLRVASHVAVAFVLGFLIAIQRGKTYWALPVSFLLGTVAGLITFFVRGQWVVQYARDAVGYGLVVISILALVWRVLPVWVTAPIALISGVGYGYLLAMEIPREAATSVIFIVMYTLGFIMTFAALMGFGLAAAMMLKQNPRTSLVLRVLTVVMLCVGLYFVLDAVSCRSNIFCQPLPERDLLQFITPFASS